MEYKLTRQCNSNITLLHFNEINNLIEKEFPLSSQGEIKLGRVISNNYLIEESPLFMNYKTHETLVRIPLNTQSIIDKFESKTKLKLIKNFNGN
jgi:hypothetical protein